MPSIYKVEWDSVRKADGQSGWIDSAYDVDDNWAGYHFNYYTDSLRKNKITADEARRILRGEQTDPKFDCHFQITGQISKYRSVGIALAVRPEGYHQQNYTVKGDSAALALGALAGTTPIGILFDRLEEFPNEVPDCPPETLRACIQYLRSKYTYGQLGPTMTELDTLLQQLDSAVSFREFLCDSDGNVRYPDQHIAASNDVERLKQQIIDLVNRLLPKAES